MADSQCLHGQTIKQTSNGVDTYWCPRCATRFSEDPLKVVSKDLVAVAGALGVLVVSMPPPPEKFGPRNPKYRKPKAKRHLSSLG